MSQIVYEIISSDEKKILESGEGDISELQKHFPEEIIRVISECNQHDNFFTQIKVLNTVYYLSKSQTEKCRWMIQIIYSSLQH